MTAATDRLRRQAAKTRALHPDAAPETPVVARLGDLEEVLEVAERAEAVAAHPAATEPRHLHVVTQEDHQ